MFHLETTFKKLSEFHYAFLVRISNIFLFEYFMVFDDVQTSFSLSDVDFGKSFVVRDFHLTLYSVLICLHLK